MRNFILVLATALTANAFAAPQVIEKLECKNERILVTVQLIQASESESANSVIATVQFLSEPNANSQVLSNKAVLASSFRDIRNLKLVKDAEIQGDVGFPSSAALLTLEPAGTTEYSSYFAFHSFVHELKCTISSN